MMMKVLSCLEEDAEVKEIYKERTQHKEAKKDRTTARKDREQNQKEKDKSINKAGNT